MARPAPAAEAAPTAEYVPLPAPAAAAPAPSKPAAAAAAAAAAVKAATGKAEPAAAADAAKPRGAELPSGMTLIPTVTSANGETAGLPAGDGILSAKPFVPMGGPGDAAALPAAAPATGFADAREAPVAMGAPAAPAAAGLPPRGGGGMSPLGLSGSSSLGTGSLAGTLAARRRNFVVNSAPISKIALSVLLPVVVGALVLLM